MKAQGKRLLQLIILLLAGIFNVVADDTVEFIEEPEESDSSEVKIDNGQGRRMPPARIIGVIDFEVGTLTGTSEKLESIEQYEVWTEEGEVCLFAGATAGEMTAALSDLGEGIYMLKLRGAGYVLIGFIER